MKTVSELTTIIQTSATTYRKLSAATQKAQDAGALDPNGPLADAIWRGFDAMLALHDPDGWISWYIYDNRCGKAGRVAGLAGNSKPKPITSPAQLAVVIKSVSENQDANDAAR